MNRLNKLKKLIPDILLVGTLTFLVAIYIALQPLESNDDPLLTVNRFVYENLLLPNTMNKLSDAAPITILEINGDDLNRFGSWPWPRARLAKGVEELQKYRPELVAISFGLDPNRHGADDQQLFTALKNAERLVLGFRADFDGRSFNTVSPVMNSSWMSKASVDQQSVTCSPSVDSALCSFPYKNVWQVSLPVNEALTSAKNIGFIDYIKTSGLIVYPSVAYYNGNYLKSYPLAVAETYQSIANPDSGVAIKLTSQGLKEFSLGKNIIRPLADGTLLLHPYRKELSWEQLPFPHVSYSNLIDGKVDLTLLKNRIVLFDLTASGYSTSYTFVRGAPATRAVIQATAVANLLENNYVRRDQRTNVSEIALIIVMALLVTFAARKLIPVNAILMTFLSVPAFLLLMSFVYLKYFNLWLMMGLPLFSALLNFAMQFGYHHLVADRQRRMVEKALKGYTSKTVMDSLINQGESFLTSVAERRDLTVLLFDIKGFTQLSHRLTPEEIFRLLNRIFEITDSIIVDRFNGMIDKKMGDACIALFGLDGATDHPLRAVQAALDIQKSFFEQFAELSKLAHKENLGSNLIQLRVGISSGTVCLGNIGSQKHMNYTAVGEVVNLAQRLEAAAPPGDVLISEETYKRLQDKIDAESRHAQGKRDEEFYLAYRVIGLK